MKHRLKQIINKGLRVIIPPLGSVEKRLQKIEAEINGYIAYVRESEVAEGVKLYPNVRLWKSRIGKNSYINERGRVSFTTIGKFCSIGPDFLCGWGIHPIDALSTHPMFYSTRMQIDITLSKVDKIVERKPITIGNDVFIGANVTVLDGVTIGDGAVIGAGAVVSKDIPPYAIAVGVPIRIVRYRFDEVTIQKLLKIRWWDFPDEQLQEVERSFFDVQGFIKKFDIPS
mgnify:CR=1 FL=1|jgi:Acetyltransferase (isoleucine patch superfamily)